MRRTVTLLSGLTLVFALAACSGGGASEAPVSEPPAATDAAASDPAPREQAAGGGTGGCAPSSEAGAVEVDIRSFTFSPAAVEAGVGETIAFTNHDDAPHTATLDEGACSTDTLGLDATAGLVFDAPGTYPFHCRVHPNMTGTITITG